MPNSVQSAFVNPLDPSSRAACWLGPNAVMPAPVRSSTIPAASGVSGPTTTSSICRRLQKSITAAWSAMSSATHSASRAMPALPGAHQSFVTKGEAAIFHAKACSRPPEPSRRMCMRKPKRSADVTSVARISLLLQGGSSNTVIPDGATELGFTRVRRYRCPSWQQPTWNSRRSAISSLCCAGASHLEIPGSLACERP